MSNITYEDVTTDHLIRLAFALPNLNALEKELVRRLDQFQMVVDKEQQVVEIDNGDDPKTAYLAQDGTIMDRVKALELENSMLTEIIKDKGGDVNVLLELKALGK